MEFLANLSSSLPLLGFIVGLASIVFGSNFLVDGASSIARKSGISEFVIGLTIVGFGTSCPELVVSLNGAIQGNADISIGNVLGSNIFNTLLILGITSIILPIKITRSNKLIDIPLAFFVSLVFVLFSVYRSDLSRLEGFFFLILFGLYIYYCFKVPSEASEESSSDEKNLSTLVSLFAVLGGLAMLIIGGKVFVDSAVVIAKNLGVSDKIIAITLLAGGTSFPELATCIVAAVKKKGQLALGNILGSNIFNVLLILGVSSLISPLSTAGMNMIDMGVLLFSTLILFLGAYTFKKNTIDRIEGLIMTSVWLLYIILLVNL